MCKAMIVDKSMVTFRVKAYALSVRDRDMAEVGLKDRIGPTRVT